MRSNKWLMSKLNIISLAIVVAILIGFYFTLLFENINLTIDNSDYYRFYYRLGLLRKIFLEYGQFPLRNPFLSGGYPILGDPYVFVLSPFHIFVLPLGEVAGLRLAIITLLLSGAFGMFFLTRHVLKYNSIGSIFSTLVFSLSSWWGYQIRGGDCDRLYYYFLPWLLAFLIKANSDRKFLILAAVMLSLATAESGLVAVAMALFLFTYACLQIKIYFRQKKVIINASYLKYFFLILLFVFLLLPIKIIPLIDLLRMRAVDYVHFIGEHSYSISSQLSKIHGHAMDWPSLRRALLDASYAGQGQMFLGIIPCSFFLLSCVIFPRENWRYLIILGVFTALLFGPGAPIDLFKLLWHSHPIMHGIWKLDKYFAFFIFFIISLIAGNIFSVSEKVKKLSIPIRTVLAIFAVTGILHMFNMNKGIIRFTYIKHPRPEKVSQFFQVGVKKYTVTGPFDDDISDEKVTRFYWLSMLQGFGVTNSIQGGDFIPISENTIPKYFIDNKYYDELRQSGRRNPMQNQKINPEYRGEVFFTHINNHVTFNLFSPNRLEAAAQINNAPDILIFNQRYDKNWTSSKGKSQNWNGLLGVSLEESGNYAVILKYRRNYILLLSLAGPLAVICIYLRWKRRCVSQR